MSVNIEKVKDQEQQNYHAQLWPERARPISAEWCLSSMVNNERLRTIPHRSPLTIGLLRVKIGLALNVDGTRGECRGHGGRAAYLRIADGSRLSGQAAMVLLSLAPCA
jgi:hypothetical protein